MMADLKSPEELARETVSAAWRKPVARLIRSERADADRRVAETRRAALDGVVRTLVEWSNPQTLRLHAGEMKAGEVLTTLAVLSALASQIRNLIAKEGE